MVIVSKCLPAPRRARYSIVIIAVPALLMNIAPRPFSFGWPLILVFWWFGVKIRFQRSHWSSRFGFILLLLFIGIMMHHLLAALFGITLLAMFWVVNQGAYYTRLGEWADFRLGWIPIGIILSTGSIFLIYLFSITGNGITILTSTLASILSDGSSSQGVSPSSVRTKQTILPLIVQALSEVLRRTSYLLMLSATVGLGVVAQLRNRRLGTPLIASGLMTGIISMLFVLVDLVLQSGGLNTRRVVVILPLILIPSVINALRPLDQPDSRYRVAMAILLVIGLVLPGVLIAYPSPLQGSIASSTTGEQVDGYQWLHQHRSAEQRVTGTSTTFWLARGLFGYRTDREWAGDSPYTGQIAWRLREESYSWQVDNRPPNTIYVIDDLEIKRSQFQKAPSKASSNRQQLNDFRQSSSQIYQNGDISFWIRYPATVSKIR